LNPLPYCELLDPRTVASSKGPSEYQLLGGIFERRTLATGPNLFRRKARSDVA
jgi:hypothetical protein